MGVQIVVVAILVFAVVTVWKGVRIVPQGEEWIVERLGKYNATLNPGLTIIVPYIDKVAYKVVTKDIILDVPQQEVITKDNAVIITNAIAFIKVTDPIKAVYGIVDLPKRSATWCRPRCARSPVKWSWIRRYLRARRSSCG